MAYAEIARLSESEIEEARKQTATAQAGISALRKIVAKHLGFDETSHIETQIVKGPKAEKTVFWGPGGECLGVYEDPPGVCRYCGPPEE
jgi:hypothetical protein